MIDNFRWNGEDTSIDRNIIGTDILRAGEVVRESSSSERDSHFGIDSHGTTDSGDERAGCGEGWLELNLVLAVVCLAVTHSDTVVTAREQEAAAASTKLSEKVANLDCIVIGDLRRA